MEIKRLLAGLVILIVVLLAGSYFYRSVLQRAVPPGNQASAPAAPKPELPEEGQIKNTISQYVMNHGVSPQALTMQISLGAPTNGEGDASVVKAMVQYDDASGKPHSGSGDFRYYPGTQASEFVNYQETYSPGQP
jgi:hypothetical protein